MFNVMCVLFHFTCAYVCIIMVYTFYSSFCVQGTAASVAPVAALSHPIEETTRDSSTGGSSRPLLVCLMVVCV